MTKEKTMKKEETRKTILTDEEYKALTQAVQFMKVNGPRSYKEGAMEPLEELLGREQVARAN